MKNNKLKAQLALILVFAIVFSIIFTNDKMTFSYAEEPKANSNNSEVKENEKLEKTVEKLEQKTEEKEKELDNLKK